MRPVAPAFVVCTGRSGSTLLSNMLRLNPGILSLSEFFAFLGPSAFQTGPMDAEQLWALLSQPNRQTRALMDSGLTIDEVLYRPGPPAASPSRPASRQSCWPRSISRTTPSRCSTRSTGGRSRRTGSRSPTIIARCSAGSAAGSTGGRGSSARARRSP